MHHSQVEIRFLIRIWFFKNPYEVVTHFTKLKKLLYFIFFGHFFHFVLEQVQIQNSLELWAKFNLYWIASGSVHIPSSRMISISSSTAFSDGTERLITSFPLYNVIFPFPEPT